MYLKSIIQTSSTDYIEKYLYNSNISSNIPIQYTKNIITNTRHLNNQNNLRTELFLPRI